jgi:pumilio RNA-binding family
LSSDSFRNEVEVLGAAGRKKRKKEKKKRRAWLEERERLGEQQGKLRCCWKLVVALVEREAMATENPVRMLSSGGGMRAGIGGRVGLGDGLRGGASILGGGGGGGGAHHHHHHSSSSMTQEGEAELGLLLNRRTRLELSEKKKGVVVPRQRSGSAPPSVEGSFAAMGGLFSYLSKNPKSGSGGARGVSKAQSGEGGGDFVVLDAEQQQRSDPAYLIYYYNNINLNPRLPPPLISWENYRLAQRLQSGMEVVGGGIGDKRRLRSLDDSSSSKSLFSTQPVLPTHREEPEPLEDDIPSPIGNLVRQSSSDWANRRVDHLMGRSSSTGLGAPHPKSLVDLIQVRCFSHTFLVPNSPSLLLPLASVENAQGFWTWAFCFSGFRKWTYYLLFDFVTRYI